MQLVIQKILEQSKQTAKSDFPGFLLHLEHLLNV